VGNQIKKSYIHLLIPAIVLVFSITGFTVLHQSEKYISKVDPALFPLLQDFNRYKGAYKYKETVP